MAEPESDNGHDASTDGHDATTDRALIVARTVNAVGVGVTLGSESVLWL